MLLADMFNCAADAQACFVGLLLLLLLSSPSSNDKSLLLLFIDVDSTGDDMIGNGMDMGIATDGEVGELAAFIVIFITLVAVVVMVVTGSDADDNEVLWPATQSCRTEDEAPVMQRRFLLQLLFELLVLFVLVYAELARALDFFVLVVDTLSWLWLWRSRDMSE